MRVPPSLGATNLPTVEDRSVGSDERSSSSRNNFDASAGASATPQQPRMKRSPYLCVMAGSTKESEDLVAMLSRPAGAGDTGGFGGGLKRSGTGAGGHHDQQGQDHHHEGLHSQGSGLGSQQGSQDFQQPSPGGSSSFFSLKRPGMMAGGNVAMMGGQGGEESHTVTPVSSAGGEFSDTQEDGTEGGGSSHGNNANEQPPRRASTAAQPTGRPLPSLRSALRMGSRTNMKAMQQQKQQQQAEQPNQMRKNSSVSFSTTTKNASMLGMVEDTRGKAGFDPQQIQQQQPHQQRVGFAQVAQMRNFSDQQSPAAPMGSSSGGGYTAEMMMKKSMSIAAPQFMLAHQNSVNSSTSSNNASFSTQGTQPTNNSSSGAMSGAGSGQGGQGGGGNASFPIYFSKLSEDQQQQQLAQRTPQQQQPTPTQQQQILQQQQAARMRSKSMSTLRYYAAGAAAANLQSNITQDPAQKLLHAAGISGVVAPVTARPSINGLNLTFREMLDEGDGKEGDLNLRNRNQQWKDFRSFSSKFEESNPMMAAMMEVENEDNVDEEEERDDNNRGGSPAAKEGPGSVGSGTSATTATTNASGAHIPLSGSKRTLTPSSLNSRTSSSSGGGGGGNAPMAGAGGPGAGALGVPPLGRSLAGSHRASVSVNDLAVLRRAAARMKMNGPGMSGNGGQERRTSQVQRLPGQTLGGDMLSRIPSASTNSATSDGNNNGGGGGGVMEDNGMSPLAQMMAKKRAMTGSSSRGNLAGAGNMPTGGGGMGSRQGSFANQQQKDLFMQKFNMAMNQHSGSIANMAGGGLNKPQQQPFGRQNANFQGSMGNLQGMGGMGRRSRTVGAGLAYGRANMTTDLKGGFRMSKFNLGDLRRESSRLSEISSQGSVGGKNEEWDLS